MRCPPNSPNSWHPKFTKRLQFDYSDRTTGPVVRAWAQLDPRIIYVENPHPRLLRDPNRPRPANLGAQLREAFNRVRDAGAWNKVDLTGVDTIRPVTFSFFPLLRVPDSDAELEAMVKAFESVAERGLGVYESTRNSIRNAMVAAASERVKNGGRAQVTTLSFHDTMNHTTTRDGAVNVLRAPADQLPDVVALSNRGDAQGNRRGEDVITMDPEALRALADCHRTGFDVAFDADVALNTPYLGSQEIIASGERFRNLTDSTFTLESGRGPSSSVRCRPSSCANTCWGPPQPPHCSCRAPGGPTKTPNGRRRWGGTAWPAGTNSAPGSLRRRTDVRPVSKSSVTAALKARARRCRSNGIAAVFASFPSANAELFTRAPADRRHLAGVVLQHVGFTVAVLSFHRVILTKQREVAPSWQTFPVA